MANFREAQQIEALVSQIISEQKQNPRYDYQSNEQREIDRLVYELYGLNEADIQEVERWFARRYPKLKDYAYVLPDEALSYVQEGTLSIEEAELWAQIARGENKHVEFKSTLLYDIKQARETYAVKHGILKTLAAFANSEGGNLLIGVTDERTVFGLDQDYTLLGTASSAPAAERWDVFRLRLDALIQEAFGNAFFGLLDTTFVKMGQHEICVVSVRPSAVPVYLQNTEKKKSQFYIRRLSSSKDLTDREVTEYLKNRVI